MIDTAILANASNEEIDEAISLLGEHTAELDRLEKEYVNEVNAAVEQGEKDLSQVEAEFTALESNSLKETELAAIEDARNQLDQAS
jgi:phage host-nuclease inhibitor protein Gam